MTFGQVEAEKIEVKDTKGHFHFSHEYVSYHTVSAVLITLLDFQNLNLTSCTTFFDIFFTKDPPFNKKNQKKIFLKILFEITQKIDVKLPENVKTENDPWCLLPQFTQL